MEAFAIDHESEELPTGRSYTASPRLGLSAESPTLGAKMNSNLLRETHEKGIMSQARHYK